MNHIPDNHIFVIFGASGDLTRRKLIPAVFSLYLQKLLPSKFAILGVARTSWSDEAFRENMRSALDEFSDAGTSKEAADGFVQCLYYQSIDTMDGTQYSQVRDKIDQVSKACGTGQNCLFYLSTPPKLYGLIPEYLAMHGLNSQESGWRRIIIEKPFGYNLESAQALNIQVLQFFQEDQVYRIDHYLGKETVQNILVFRFANEIFDDLWNYRHIDHVEITSAEQIGVGSRGGYYDQSGAVRDMVQNHLLQVLALVAIEPPIAFDADNIRYEALKVFKSLRRLGPKSIPSHCVFGQYTSATVRNRKVKGYREEEGVPTDSRTDTFAAFKFFVDNSRWFKVPFYLRVGKCLPTRATEVVVHFNKTPHPAFGIKSALYGEQNQLILRIQPNEGILLKFGLKSPGAGFKVENVNMDFEYSNLSNQHLPEPYERLILDCMMGDATLYAHGNAIEECWKFIDPYIKYKEENAPIYGYPAGTWGPKESFELLKKDRRVWRYPSKNLSNDGIYCEL